MITDTTPEIRTILKQVLKGERISPEDAVVLFQAKGRDVLAIASTADRIREDRAGGTVTYVRNQNINVTNICVNSCAFCGFSRKPGSPDSYLFPGGIIRDKVRQAKARRVSEICTVSGLHPDFNADSYLAIIRLIREEAPGIHIHASNPMEVSYAARKSGCTTRAVLSAMKDAGLGSLCGTAAEILVDQVREQICPQKISTAEWIRIIREAHGLGIPTTATIMYGHCESDQDRAVHLGIIRDIQDGTGGFTEFVPLSFVHPATRLFLEGKARAGATGREDILMIAVSRLFLDNFRNIQVSWVKEGTKMAQVLLASGGNDLGGTMYEESISKGAGATGTDFLDPVEMERMALDLGRDFAERTTLYAPVRPGRNAPHQ
jgi:FO synthase subunit 2